ncbi:16113_t:CDS:2, partial [Gigaspora rosea]
MEYNIRSNNDSINKDILAALKDLDDTFFVDYLDSKDEESNSVLDDESISDEDIPLNKLNDSAFLEKNMRDLVIKGQPIAFQKNESMDRVTNEDGKNLSFGYCYNHDIQVCLDTYLTFVEVSRKYLNNTRVSCGNVLYW